MSLSIGQISYINKPWWLDSSMKNIALRRCFFTSR